MKVLLLLICGAVSPYLFDATLPGWLAMLLLLGISLLLLKPAYRLYALPVLGFVMTTLALNARIDQRLPESLNRTVQTLQGEVVSLPEFSDESVSFLFRTGTQAGLSSRLIRVYWRYGSYARTPHENTVSEIPELKAGQGWRLKLELRSTRSRVNFHGMDFERSMFAQGIYALAYVQQGDNEKLSEPGLLNLQHWREKVFEKLQSVAADVPSFRFLVALAIADRRAMVGTDREVLSATGTGHLLAISGLHIGLAAVLGFQLGRLLLLPLPYVFGLRLAVALPWLCAWGTALAYSAVSGFGVSTQRALVMLTVASIVILARRKTNPLQGWLIAMALVLLLDPFAPMRAGFWFSFIAVAVLLFLFVPRLGRMPHWKSILLAQCGISLVMAPLGMYWFQQASVPGLLANLVAIPVVSFLVVPLILVAMLLLWVPGSAAYGLLYVAGLITHWLIVFLQHLSALQPDLASVTRVPGLLATLIAIAGGLIIMLPGSVRFRVGGLLLMLPMLLPVTNPLSDGVTRIDMLDVGQGMSVLVGNRDFLLVYDTGPGNGLEGEAGWDTVDSVIQPMIAARGRKPDLVVASHADLDHAGGLERLQGRYPSSAFWASLSQSKFAVDRCTAGEHWSDAGLKLTVLHPAIGLPYLGNDSSCVISIRTLATGLLLTGDISRNVEQRLVRGDELAHAIMTIPHHGSSSSSTRQLINRVKPDLVLVSAGYGNRYGLPRDDVLDRYRQSGARVLNTAECGGIRITASNGGTIELKTARISKDAIWRWPAATACKQVL